MAIENGKFYRRTNGDEPIYATRGWAILCIWDSGTVTGFGDLAELKDLQERGLLVEVPRPPGLGQLVG